MMQQDTEGSGRDPLEFLNTEQLQKYFNNRQTKDSIPINQKEKADYYSTLIAQRTELRSSVLLLFSEFKYEEALPHCKRMASLGKAIFNMQEPDKKEIFDFAIGNLFYIKCLLKTDNIELCRKSTHSLWLFIDKVIHQDLFFADILQHEVESSCVLTTAGWIVLPMADQVCC